MFVGKAVGGSDVLFAFLHSAEDAKNMSRFRCDMKIDDVFS